MLKAPQNPEPCQTLKPFPKLRHRPKGVAILLAALLPVGAVQGEETLLLSPTDNFDVTFSGQINRALLIANDGGETTLLNVDNNNSSSRIRFIAESNNEGPLSAGAAYEAEFTINNSAGISQEDTDDNETDEFEARRAEIYVSHDRLGKLWLGQGPTATDSISQQDLSGTMNAGFSFVSLVGGGILFRDRSTGELSNTDLGDVSDNLDGFGRNTRLRYDTPEFADWQLRTSVINDGAMDVSAFYGSDIQNWRLVAAVGYGNARQIDDTPDYDRQASGSLSVRHESGLNLTLATGVATAIDSARENLNFVYGKLGYRHDFFPGIGNTALSADWGQTRNEDRNDDLSDTIGVQIAQEIDVVSLETYATVRHASLDRDGEDFEDSLIGMLGARLDF